MIAIIAAAASARMPHRLQGSQTRLTQLFFSSKIDKFLLLANVVGLFVWVGFFFLQKRYSSSTHHHRSGAVHITNNVMRSVYFCFFFLHILNNFIQKLRARKYRVRVSYAEIAVSNDAIHTEPNTQHTEARDNSERFFFSQYPPVAFANNSNNTENSMHSLRTLFAFTDCSIQSIVVCSEAHQMKSKYFSKFCYCHRVLRNFQ